MASLTIDGRRSLSALELRALHSLRRRYDESRLLVAGATALRCFRALTHRATDDVDLVVATDAGLVASDLRHDPEWKPDSGIGHRWFFSSELRVDIIAVGADPSIPAIVRQGDREFATAGIMSAFAHAERLYLGDGIAVSVATRASVVIMKAAAFLDRTWERTRDIDDVVAMMESYAQLDDSLRFADDVIALEPPLDADDVDALILGRNVRRVASEAEIELVRRFLNMLRDETKGFASHATRRASGRGRDDEGLTSLLQAFERGLLEGTP